MGTTPPVPTTPHYQNYFNTGDSYEANNWVDAKCAEISFLNIGDGNFPTPAGADVKILGFVIKPGFGVSFDGNDGELDITRYYITFSGAGVRNCLVLRKNYTK